MNGDALETLAHDLPPSIDFVFELILGSCGLLAPGAFL